MVQGYVIVLQRNPHPSPRSSRGQALPPQAGEGAAPSLALRAGEGWGGGAATDKAKRAINYYVTRDQIRNKSELS